MKPIFLRELRISLRTGGGFGPALVFFAAFALLVPFGIGPEIVNYQRIAPGFVWVGALLACLLSHDAILNRDFEDGTLRRLTLSPIPLEAVIIAKTAAHWSIICLPLCLISPVIGLLFSLDFTAGLAIALTLFLGTPAISAIAVFGAALTLGLNRGELLSLVLVIPACVPTLILGSMTTFSIATGLPSINQLAILTGLSLAVLALLPFAASYLLRQNLNR
ncbi:MAG: heme exporter protein CcmB [Rhodobacteraceae bacterium]|nr:heme exporter protein CcmB [Paracoccaceae bacterium]